MERSIREWFPKSMRRWKRWTRGSARSISSTAARRIRCFWKFIPIGAPGRKSLLEGAVNTGANAAANRTQAGKPRTNRGSKGELTVPDTATRSSQEMIEVFKQYVIPNYVRDRKSTRLNSSHEWISYAVF